MYIELHSRSAFSFLEGASLPEALVEVYASLGMPAMALLDRDGVYGAPRFHLAAKKAGIRALIGAEVSVSPLFASENVPRGTLENENQNQFQTGLCSGFSSQRYTEKMASGQWSVIRSKNSALDRRPVPTDHRPLPTAHCPLHFAFRFSSSRARDIRISAG